jgi:prepilin-type N-terminal cleavage/methylation domain-containing protein
MRSASSPQRGFTLVEMLVSVTILSFMLIMMAKITGLVEFTWHQAQNRIDNFTKARSMLDLVSSDLQRAVFRGDLPVFGTGGPAATPAVTSGGLYYFTGTKFTTAFYTRLPGASTVSGSSVPVRDVSLVSYTLTTTTDEDKIVLQRSDLAVPWTSGTYLSFQSDITPLLSNTNAVASEVAPGVVGFAWFSGAPTVR